MNIRTKLDTFQANSSHKLGEIFLFVVQKALTYMCQTHWEFVLCSSG